MKCPQAFLMLLPSQTQEQTMESLRSSGTGTGVSRSHLGQGAAEVGVGMERRLLVVERSPGLASSAPHLLASQQLESVIWYNRGEG